MNHPKRAEWIPLLFGEANAKTRQRLDAHLRECAECAQEVNAWRRTMGRLDAWKLPQAPKPGRSLPWRPVAWAAAAAVVMGAFVAGRFTAPTLDVQTLRTVLKSELSEEIQRGFARVSSESSAALANLEVRLASASIQNNKDMAEEFVQAINSLRTQDHEATAALFAKLEKQYTTDFVLLRRDLETLASTTDEEIESARLKLYQLASNRTE
ncbi:MAG TPA: zf-HC2 domain-containing protein [Methylomirabilota bacterium]|nr:zf-HC2 domain-containing protein [Methylomirabilota bacterium]